MLAFKIKNSAVIRKPKQCLYNFRATKQNILTEKEISSYFEIQSAPCDAGKRYVVEIVHTQLFQISSDAYQVYDIVQLNFLAPQCPRSMPDIQSMCGNFHPPLFLFKCYLYHTKVGMFNSLRANIFGDAESFGLGCNLMQIRIKIKINIPKMDQCILTR